MAIDYAFVRLLPVDRPRAGLEPHLQADVLALGRCGLAGVLDVQVAVRLVVLSGWEGTASCVRNRSQHRAKDEHHQKGPRETYRKKHRAH